MIHVHVTHKTSHWPNAGSMLAHRLRRWPNIDTAMGEWLAFSGYLQKWPRRITTWFSVFGLSLVLALRLHSRSLTWLSTLITLFWHRSSGSLTVRAHGILINHGVVHPPSTSSSSIIITGTSSITIIIITAGTAVPITPRTRSITFIPSFTRDGLNIIVAAEARWITFRSSFTGARLNIIISAGVRFITFRSSFPGAGFIIIVVVIAAGIIFISDRFVLIILTFTRAACIVCVACSSVDCSSDCFTAFYYPQAGVVITANTIYNL